jgi:rhodanese-related sulfurtransferase
MRNPTLFQTGIPTRRGYRDVTPAQTHDARGHVRIVDVRETDELTGPLGHIPGVEHAPLATVLARAASWPKDEELILVCRSGGRSSGAAEALVAAGFRKVMNMAGGMLAYNAAGLPVTRT